MTQIFFNDDYVNQKIDDPFLKPIHSDELSQKIASISRSIANVGMRLKIHALDKDQLENANEILKSIDGLLQDLLLPKSDKMSSHTIYERPSLREALRIISTYELIFCIMAMIVVLYFSII